MDSGSWSNCTSSKSYSIYQKAAIASRLELQMKLAIPEVQIPQLDNRYYRSMITISSGPDSITNVQSATFEFSSNEDDSTFECKMDSEVGLIVQVLFLIQI